VQRGRAGKRGLLQAGKRCRQANAAGLARHNTLLRSANAPPDDEARLFVLTETSVVPAASLNGCSVLADQGLHKNKERMNGTVNTTSKVLVAQVQSLVGGNDCIKFYCPTLRIPCVIM